MKGQHKSKYQKLNFNAIFAIMININTKMAVPKTIVFLNHAPVFRKLKGPNECASEDAS
jgi:hypothetical protein